MRGVPYSKNNNEHYLHQIQHTSVVPLQHSISMSSVGAPSLMFRSLGRLSFTIFSTVAACMGTTFQQQFLYFNSTMAR